MREQQVRDAVRALNQWGVTVQRIADDTGLSRETVYRFLDEDRASSADTLDKMDRWLRQEWDRARPERVAVAGVLRWMAKLLEEGATLPSMQLLEDELSDLRDASRSGGKVSENGEGDGLE